MAAMVVSFLIMSMAMMDAPTYSPTTIPSESHGTPEGPSLGGPTISSEAISTLTKMNGFFIENKGQLDDEGVKYYAPGNPLSVYLGVDWMAYSLVGVDDSVSVVKVAFEGADPVEPQGRNALSHATNYIIGRDPAGWVRDARSFHEVIYTDPWDEVDIRFYFNEGRFKYDIIVHQGGSPSDIVMEYDGVDSLSLDQVEGHLLISTPSGDIIDESPITSQYVDGTYFQVPSKFKVLMGNRVGLWMGKYDTTIDLVIDPGVEFSSFFGGSSTDRFYGSSILALGGDGSIYVTAGTFSIDLPVTPGAYSSSHQNNTTFDCFFARLNANASQLITCTYFGGSGFDQVYGIDVDINGNAYVIGSTFSQDFPMTQDAFCATLHAGDAFLLGFNATGWLTYGSYFGGSSGDAFQDLTLAENGDVVMVGGTTSTDYPTTSSAYCSTYSQGWDTIVTRYSPSSNSIVFSTYIGGTIDDIPFATDTDDSGNVYVTGGTNSTDWPTTNNAYCQTHNGDWDIFIFKLTSDGSRLLYSTLIGGSDSDYPFQIEVDTNGEVWICGGTSSKDVPVSDDAYMSEYGGGLEDGLFIGLSSNGSLLNYSSYFGGPDQDQIRDIDISLDGEVVLYIKTTSADLFTPLTAYDRTYDTGWDVFVAWVDIEKKLLVNATYLGGRMVPYGDVAQSGGLHVVSEDLFILVGDTNSKGFPTTLGAYDRTLGGMDVFIVGLSMERTPWDPPSVPLNLTVVPGDGSANLTWSVPVDAGPWPIEGYRVYRGTEEGKETLFTEVPISNRYTNYGLTNGQTYYYKVKAYNYAGEGPLTGSVDCTPFGVPSAPENFTAIPDGVTVLLAWDPPLKDGGIPLEGYLLFRGLSASNLTILSSTDLNTTYLDKGLEAGSTYYYSVRAYHTLGNGTWSPILNVKALGPPSVPTGFEVMDDDGSIVISWDPPLDTGGTELTAYRLYRGYDEYGLEHYIRLGPFLNNFIDVNVAIGTTYCYAVVAENAMGASPMTHVICLMPTGPPGTPVGVEVISGDGWVNLSWEAAISNGGLPVLGFFVYRSIDDASFVQLGDVKDAMWFNDTEVVNGEAYYYGVSAYNARGEGPMSTQAKGTPMGLPPPPISISVTEGYGWLEITWAPPMDTKGSPLIGYNIYRGTSPADMVVISNPGSRQTSHMDPGLVPGATYHYAMSSITAAGEGPLSGIVTGTPYELPTGPTDLVAVGKIGSIEISWSPPLDDGGRMVYGYLLYRGIQAGVMDELFVVGANTSYVDSNVEPGVTYRYSVSAITVGGEGIRSGEVMATPELPVYPPGPPRALIGKVENGRVILTWLPPLEDGGADVAGYNIHRGESISELYEIATLDNELTFTDEDVVGGKTYRYAVVAVNVAGQGERSQIISVDVRALDTSLSDEVPLWLVLVGIGLFTILSLGIMASTEPFRYRLALLMVPLLMGKDEVLDNKIRYLLHGIIAERPGIHYTAIKEDLDLPNGVAVYHLNVLEKEDFIRSVRDGRLKRFYSTDTKVPENPQMTPEETREAIIHLVSERPGISQKRIINELGISRDSVGYFLRELVKESQLADSREGQFTVYRVKG